MNELTQKNAELGRFLFCERYTLQPVKNSLFIAEGQNLKRGAVVDVNGVLVGTNSLMPYAVLENDCDTRAKGAFASVFVKGEFNFDKLFFADGLSKEDLDNIVYNGSGIGLVIKPYDYAKDFSPLMVPAGTSQSNPLMNAAETERMINAMKPIDAMTLRFEFSKKDYNPQTAGIGSAGTWTKLVSPTLNIWDWTNTNTDWHKSFEGAFPDEDNKASVIAAGDTSSVTDFENMFAGIYTGTPEGGSSYNLVTRNNIVECVGFNISNATDARYMFIGSTLKHGNFDLSHLAQVTAFYADTYIEKIGDIDCSSADYIGMLFCRCSKLLDAGSIKVSATCQKAPGVFAYCSLLEHFVGLIGDTSNIYIYQTYFQSCYNLKQVDIPLDFSAVTQANCAGAFNGCRALPKTAFVNLTDKVTNLQAFLAANYVTSEIPIDEMDTSNVSNFSRTFSNMHEIDKIPDLDVSSATNVDKMFGYCYKVKYGILEMYNKLLARGAAITNHANCFTDCGRDTPEGRAALAQIPASWGGTAAG